MSTYIARRVFQAGLLLIGISTVVFFILRVSGDPVSLFLPLDATQEERAIVREQFGLSDPVIVQYGRFLGRLLQGDLGRSIRNRQPSLSLVVERLPATVELAVSAIVITIVVAFPIGILSAIKRNTVFDRLAMVFALTGQSMPVFWIGIMMILVFAVELHWFPTGGRGTLRHLVMPAVTLSLFHVARTARLVRSCMLEVMGQDYVRTARAKGLPERSVILRHAIRNALIPIVTVLGLDLAGLLGGAIITETIFSWPGVGRLVINAIETRDYPVVQACVLVVAGGYLVMNQVVDVFYGLLNPRIRYT